MDLSRRLSRWHAAEAMDHHRRHAPVPQPISGHRGDETAAQFFAHSTARRVATDAVIAAALQQQYPNLKLSITPAGNCNLLGFAAAGHASYTPWGGEPDDCVPSSLAWKAYASPARRMDGNLGELQQMPKFGKYLYKWKGSEFIVYLVDGRDGSGAFPANTNYYVLSTDEALAEDLLLSAGRWGGELHGEIWVFEGGSWEKSSQLFESAMKASWDAVILDREMKDAIIEDHLSFFRSRSTYARLKIPWKRGVIYYGPPGNGKTISIKATMKMLYSLEHSVPTLYVRSLASFFGPEQSIKLVFNKAREFAPCYLVFEDLDTIVTDSVRSFFLNELDGLKNNDGIFVIGSTNHLDRLDPGISKRPSRFDRKYLFPDPNFDQRVAYCQFWQKKLASNKRIEFPNKLCMAIAQETDQFSFAYMQEAFVAALLLIARDDDDYTADGQEAGRDKLLLESKDRKEGLLTRDLAVDDGWVEVLEMEKADGEGPDLDDLVLWVEIKKQIDILREGMRQGA
ncbi:putative ATPase [Escovopsis weberi]|uniref:Putative ATPase n=1 Tax=Escovopsis weberi TaxID=150374 RepID=A0A0M9VS68_ESCWE|nr:putative ATPase [Escovopsis weberi]